MMKHFKLIFLFCLTVCLFTFSSAYADEFSETSSSDSAASDLSSSNPPAADDAAKDDTQVYRLSDDLSLVSTIKFQYGVKPKLFVKSVFPLMENDNEEDNLANFNDTVTSMIKQIVAEFKNQTMQNMAAASHLPKTFNKNDLYIDYDASFVNSDDSPIISIRFTMQGFLAGMAHPYHVHRVLNFDLSSGQTIELNNLFLPNSNYLNVLSQYTTKRLARRFSNKEFFAKGAAPAAENFRNWNIKPNGLLITFDEYQVAPYIHGAQTVLVPYSVLRKIIAPDAPIAGCVAHARKCSQSNLLTGGFIDEAVNTHHRGLNPVLS